MNYEKSRNSDLQTPFFMEKLPSEKKEPGGANKEQNWVYKEQNGTKIRPFLGCGLP